MSREAFTARTEAQIKQLCCLGLGGEAIMPALLRELHRIIPFHDNTFYWADEHGHLSNACDEHPEFVEFGALYIKEYCDRREKEVHPGFTQAVCSKRVYLGYVPIASTSSDPSAAWAD